MSVMTTYTGKDFDPINPSVELLDILDIAHALSMICRFNRHTKRFYSAAQHSIFCALEALKRGLSKEIIIGCLLHDASEAYLSDIIRPIKKELNYYLEVEDRLQNLIWNHFIGRPLTSEEIAKVFEIDDLMLSLEFNQLMPKSINQQYKKLLNSIECKFKLPMEVEEEFIKLYYKYY